jgi:hypothetical protein
MQTFSVYLMFSKATPAAATDGMLVRLVCGFSGEGIDVPIEFVDNNGRVKPDSRDKISRGYVSPCGFWYQNLRAYSCFCED